MTYKGYEIVAVYTKEEVWRLNNDGTEPFQPITDYDIEFKYYQIWNTEEHCIHEDFEHITFAYVQEAKNTIDAKTEDDMGDPIQIAECEHKYVNGICIKCSWEED